MNSKNSLLIGRGIFIVIITVVLGLIIINEKGGEIFKSKIDTKIIEYLETNYQELLEKTNYEETTYKNKIFSKKIVSKENKNHYFYIQYKNKKITDTYKKDYEEGTTLLNYLNRKLEKEIKKKTNVECKVNPINKLNGYSDKVQEKLLKEDHLLELKYYYISKDIIISDWNKEEIVKEITSLIQLMKENNITPKYYEITITNKEDITNSIQISNITENFLDMSNKEKVIEDIINQKETDELKESKITFRYEN